MSERTTPRDGRPTQECPICGATQPLSARTCSICGAVLPGERTPIAPSLPVERPAKPQERPRYDPALGDDDLYSGDLTGRMWRLVLVGGIVLALAVGLVLGLVIGQSNGGDDDSDGGGVFVEGLDGSETPLPTLMPGETGPTAPPTATPRNSATPTATVFLSLPTVTPMPPTATATPTPGPCYQTAQTGDTVLGMAYRCGHRDMSIVELILEINDMSSPQELQLGQTLEIPWPTPTGGPPTAEGGDAAGEGEDTGAALPPDTSPDTSPGEPADAPAETEMVLNAFGTPDALASYQNVEPTLRPGLAWHNVVTGETIMGVAYQYDTDVETLSQINPEVPFRQCDYGLRYGGPNCAVMLYEGQRIRVPVPIPTITPTVRPSGPLTPTPTPSPTFNAPYPLMPENGEAFLADEIVTLRWGGTGTLGPDERYVVRVLDMEAGEQHVAFVQSRVYQLPGGWQPGDGERHTFEWQIAVAVVDDQMRIVSEDYTTEPRRFTWESR